MLLQAVYNSKYCNYVNVVCCLPRLAKHFTCQKSLFYKIIKYQFLELVKSIENVLISDYDEFYEIR